MKSIDILRKVLLAGLFLVPFIPLIVARDMFFPFITGKGFAFRVLIEILFFLWVVLAVNVPTYRPKKGPILAALTGLLAVLTLSTIFGENPYKSFWSNFERMEGLVTHIHLFTYFIVLISTLHTEKLWKWFWHTSIGVSLLMGIYGVFQLFGVLQTFQGSTRLEATFGNATYLAVYMLFHMFITTFYFFNVKTSKRMRYIYGVIIFFQGVILFYTATRGAILGLVAGIVLAAILNMVFSKSHSKKIPILLIGMVFVLSMIFVLVKDADFVQENNVLKRFATISLTERTVESRFIIWGMSTNGFLDRPVLGYGPENYNIVFNKYYDPQLWRQEPWFDRAHNFIFDWLITTGAVGLLAYLSVFGSALYVLWRKIGGDIFKGTIGKSVLTGLLGAYMFQNMFVFDNLSSYILFISVLGFIHVNSSKSNDRLWNKVTELLSRRRKFISIGVAPASLLFLIVTIYFINVPPILANKALLDSIVPSNNVENNLKNFKKVFDINSFANIEASEQLLSVAVAVQNIEGISVEVKQEFFSLARNEMEKRTEEYPNDARLAIFTGSFLSNFGFIEEGRSHILRARDLSPRKQSVLFSLADTYIREGDNDKALDILKTAYELETAYNEAALNFAVMAIRLDKEEVFPELAKPIIESSVPADRALINAYSNVGNTQKVIEVWTEIIRAEELDVFGREISSAKRTQLAQNHVSLAAAFFESGERSSAILELEKAIEIDENFKEQGSILIDEIKAGRNPGR